MSTQRPECSSIRENLYAIWDENVPQLFVRSFCVYGIPHFCLHTYLVPSAWAGWRESPDMAGLARPTSSR